MIAGTAKWVAEQLEFSRRRENLPWSTHAEIAAMPDLSPRGDSRLYRQSHPTFEAYCRERWGMSRPRAYEVMGAAEAVCNLSAMADIPLPANERQARPEPCP